MKKFLFIFVALLAFTSSIAFEHFYSRNDDLSIRYILWKHSLYPYRNEFIGGVIADRHFQNQLVGKTKAEILQIFPNAHEEAKHDSQRLYEKVDLIGREYLWLGDGMTVIFFENGFATYVGLMKG